ncbi:MAG: DUF350 domain-containing protein [Euryarchaeota archaeon]|nr:DUF350 domain-containing protein [Euryarchaeota archaeon]
MLGSTLLGLFLAFVQLIIGLILSIATIYLGISLLDVLTKGVDYWDELKNGNVAIGILVAAVVVSISLVVQSGVAGLNEALFGIELTSPTVIISAINRNIAGISQVLIGIILAVVAIYLAIHILDKVAVNIELMEELKGGNVAVAIVTAGVLIAISFVIQAGVTGIYKMIAQVL